MKMNINITKSELHEAIAQYYGIPVEKISSINVIEENSTQNPSKELWYPDDSGEWIETNGEKPNIEKGVEVYTISDRERAKERWFGSYPMLRDGWAWGCIVAYKLA